MQKISWRNVQTQTCLQGQLEQHARSTSTLSVGHDGAPILASHIATGSRRLEDLPKWREHSIPLLSPGLPVSGNRDVGKIY